MRVFPCMIVLAILCTACAGCSAFKKNTNGTQQPPAGGGAQPAKFPGGNDPLLPTPPPPAFPGTPTAGKAPTTILAGSVTDAYHRPVGGAYIRWVRVDEKDAGAPIDVAADANGYFIIQGVKPGGMYKLIARTKQGEQLMAGESLISAPNVHILIPIRADLVNSSTPPLPSGPAYQAPPAQGATMNVAPKGEPNLPATIRVPAPSVDTPVGNPANIGGNPSFVPGVVETPKDRLPMLKIPIKPAPIVPNNPPRPPLPTPGDAKLDTGPTRVPSCVLVGSRLENLALKDSKGQTWEYKKQGYGKLVLLDFWGTHCPPCRETMPVLNRLHMQYGSRGLEVIGIALEAGQNERKEADAVNKLCAAMQVNYRQLMGRTPSLDVGKQFKVEGLPTLLLLDEQGYIRYQHLGRPDAADVAELERIIQSRLNNRAF